MAVKLATTSGNLTTAGTWQDVANLSDYESSVQGLSNTWQGAGTFTPGAVTIDGLVIKIAYHHSTYDPTGDTMAVRLYNSTDAAVVAGTTVTINVLDLWVGGVRPYDGNLPQTNIQWVYFKFAAPVLLTAAKAYIVQATCSEFNLVQMFYSGVNYTFARGIVLNGASAAAPTTGDQLIIVGSRTGAGNLTPVTVTMDQTSSAVKYGTTSTTLTSITIGQGGILDFGYAAATNYYMNVQGILTVSFGGTLTIGTVANPIPRDSTATLNFDITGSAGAYSLRCQGTFTAQGLSRTVGKNVVGCLLTSTLSALGTTLNVDRDTGWKSGDVIRIGGTQQSGGKGDSGTLSGDASASAMTITVGVTNAHEGTVATGKQAEVILSTRNVTVRTTTAGKGTYLYLGYNSAIDFDWVAFVGMGAGSSPYGMSINGNASFGLDYCHFDPNGGSTAYGVTLYSSSATIPPQFNMTLTHNTAFQMIDWMYQFQGTSGTHSAFALTLEDHWVVGGPTWGYAGFLYEKDIMRAVTVRRGRFAEGYSTNPTMLFNPGEAWNYGGGGPPKGWLIEDCVFHGMGYPVSFSGTNSGFVTFRRCKWWRIKTNGEIAVYVSASWRDVLFEDCEFQATYLAASYIVPAGSVDDVIFRRCKFGNEATYQGTHAIYFGATGGQNTRMRLRFEECLFGTAAGGTFTNLATADFGMQSVGNHQDIGITFVNCVRGAGGTQFSSVFLDGITGRGYLAFQREEGVLGAHRIRYPRLGVVARDATVYRSSPASEKMTPAIATTSVVRLCSQPKRFDVTLAAQRSPSVWVRTDAAYNGLAPRLIMRANAAVGVNDDTVLATHSLVSGSWVQLTGAMPSPAEDEGQVEVYVDCNGTAGNVWVDDWSI